MLPTADPGVAGRRGLLILDAVAMQIVAVGIEPGLGALDMTADPADHPPEPRRMIHLDEMRHLMGGEIVQHVRAARGSAATRTTASPRRCTNPSGSTDRGSTAASP